jgi:hypothetical protein
VLFPTAISLPARLRLPYSLNLPFDREDRKSRHLQTRQRRPSCGYLSAAFSPQTEPVFTIVLPIPPYSRSPIRASAGLFSLQPNVNIAPSILLPIAS